MNWLELPERRLEIGMTPVTWGNYARSVRQTRRTRSLRSDAARRPVTNVSVAEAVAFAEWLSRRDVHRYDLPVLDDIRSLADRMRPASGAVDRPEDLHHAMLSEDPDLLSEWLACLPPYSNHRNRLHCLGCLSWYLSRKNASARASLADGRYSFVTFRLVRSSS